jgi:hypothetical protein
LFLKFSAAMPRYFFDVRDGDNVAPDDEGLELPATEAAWDEAAHSLADMLRDAVRMQRQGEDHRMAVEVRDDNGPVLTVEVSFKAKRHRLDA